MSAFVVLAVTLAVAAVGVVVVAAIHVMRSVRRLGGQMSTAFSELNPLLRELEAESAVMATELEAIEETRRAGRALRAPARHRGAA